MSTQFPAAGVQIKALPTFSGYTVTKAEPSKFYATTENVTDENGELKHVVGVDETDTIDVEMVMLTSTTLPEQLTTLTDGSSNAWLIVSPVKEIGEAGQSRKISCTLHRSEGLAGAGGS